MGLKDFNFDLIKRPLWVLEPNWHWPDGRVRIRLNAPSWEARLYKMQEWCVKHECGYLFRSGHDDSFCIDFPSEAHYIMFSLV